MEKLTSLSEHSDQTQKLRLSDRLRWHLHRLRVTFGRQPLEIWQFVPSKFVDGVWVVLEEPKDYKVWINGGSAFMNIDEILPCQEYEQAKERCLFKGFELDVVYDDRWVFIKDVFWVNIKKKQTIEDLVKYNLQLTATAQKQIGL